MPISSADDKFYYTDTGGRIYKDRLSESRRKEYDSALADTSRTEPIKEPAITVPNMEKYQKGISSVRNYLRDLTGRPEEPQSAPAVMQAAQPVAPQSAPLASNAVPMLSAINAPTSNDIWEQPAAFDIADPSQFGQAAPNQQASTTDLLPYNQPPVAADPYGFGQISKDTVKSYAQQSKAITDMAKIDAKKNAEIAKANLDTQRTIDMVDYERSVIGEKKANAVNTVMADMEATRQELASAKIDPDRFFGNSTGKRIAAGIAIAFGAIGQALTKSNTNAALDIINGAIDNDIKAQKENVGITKDRLSAQRQLLSDTYTKFGDLESQQLAQRITATEMAQRKISDIAARYGTQEALAKAEMINGQLGVKLQDDLLKLTTLKANQAAATAKMTPAGLTSDQVKIVSDMAGSYEKNEGIGSYNKIDLAYRKMENLAKQAKTNPNAAQGIITTFNRVLDENSAVREAEVNMTLQAGSLVDRFRNQSQKALTGTMTTEQVKNLIDAAKQIQMAALEGKQRIDQRFKQRAEAFGVPSDLVITASPVSKNNAQQELSSFTPQGEQSKQKTQTANRVIPGR